MNIVVLMKRTFDTEEKIEIKNNKIEDESVEFVINPYDEYAVEEGIRQREKHGGDVTLLCVGPPEADKEIRTALAMGADKAVLIETDDTQMDEHIIAHVVASVIKKQPFDIILGGNVSVDNAAGQVAPRVAELLDIPQVTTITNLEIQDSLATVERDVEGDVEIVETSLPALFTAQQGLNDPRYPSLPGIMKAKKKPLERLDISELLDATHITSKTETIQVHLPPKKESGQILEGEQQEQVQKLVRLLRHEAKVV